MIGKGSRLGKFEIIDKLGAGGMADVYLAEDTSLRRQVALKILPPAFTRDEALTARFEKEVLHCASLQHPGIVTIFEVAHEGDYHYYTMALLNGGDLKRRIAAGVSVPQALELLKQIADALGYAHGKGFVHRDLKPENIIFDDHGRPVITDFGIAKAVGSGTKMTGTGMSIGTPHYMSPEQSQGKADIDGRSDLYALGIILHEMLTGSVPFDADNTVGIAMQHVQAPLPQLPSNLGKLQPLLDRLLAKNPSDRYNNAAELITAIDQALSGQALSKTPRQQAVVSPKTQVIKSAPEQKGSGLKWAVGGAVLATVLIGGFVVLNGGSNDARATRSYAGGSSPAAQTTYRPEQAKTVQDISPEQKKRVQVDALLADAEEDLAAMRLMKPDGNNALEKYRQVLQFEPGNLHATEGLKRVAEAYVALAKTTLQKGEFNKAQDYVANAESIMPGLAGLTELKLTYQHLVYARNTEAARKVVDDAKAAAQTFTDPTTGMEFVQVKGGCFQMGSNNGADDEKPVHEVCVDDFYLGKYEVTQAQWQKMMRTSVSQQRDKADSSWPLRGESSSHPMYYVSWDEAQDYVRTLSQRGSKKFRLPTEAEWEYAARSGGKNEKWAGTSSVSSLGDYAWYDKNSGSKTHPVGQKRPNGLGLYDMSGNVWEWCSDWYGDKTYASSPRNNPQGPSSGSYRVFRGGSWLNSPGLARSADRYGSRPGFRSYNLGFRVAFPAGL